MGIFLSHDIPINYLPNELNFFEFVTRCWAIKKNNYFLRTNKKYDKT